MRICITIILTWASYVGFAQRHINSNPSAITTNLDLLFPIDNISQITVINNYGKHLLTAMELQRLKVQLKRAKFAGGLLMKPGHIILDIKLKDNRIIKAGLVYASTGQIHFDGGTSKFNEHFSGTFILPDNINFDQYKNH